MSLQSGDLSSVLRMSDTLLAHDRNHFTLVRWILASAVIFTHAFDLTGVPGGDPLLGVLGVAVSGLAVDGFFVVSGFLVAMSLERSRSLVHFIAARVLRIYPALIVVLILSAFILGPAVTSYPIEEYALNLDTYRYVIQNLVPMSYTYDLPGVFSENPFGAAVNGSLWTIRFEIYCYALLALIAVAGLYRPLGWISVGLAALLLHGAAIVFALLPDQGWFWHTLKQLGRLLPCFAIGVGFYLLRNKMVYSWWGCVLLVMIWVGLNGTPVKDLARTLALAYLIFCIAFLSAGSNAPMSKMPDYSYGIYIYAFPVQQTLVAMGWAVEPYLNMALTLMITVVIAALSWNFIEKPAIKLKDSALVTRLAALVPIRLLR